MPWALEEPRPLDEKVSLRHFRGRFDLGQDFVYGSSTGRRPRSSAARLHTRLGDGALEIGYWLRASRLGAGSRERRPPRADLCRISRQRQVDRVEIRIDPANEASLEILRALGFVEEGTLRRRLPPGGDGVPRDMVLFATFRHAFEESPLARTELDAFDAGRSAHARLAGGKRGGSSYNPPPMSSDRVTLEVTERDADQLGSRRVRRLRKDGLCRVSSTGRVTRARSSSASATFAQR